MKVNSDNTSDFTLTANSTNRNDKNFLLSATNLDNNFLLSATNANDSLRSFDENPQLESASSELYILKTMETQQAQGDLAAVRQSAHRIKGAAAMIGASYLAKFAGALEVGGNKEAATPHVLDDLRVACNELERMLLAGKFQKIRAPHHESTDRDHSSHT